MGLAGGLSPWRIHEMERWDAASKRRQTSFQTWRGPNMYGRFLLMRTGYNISAVSRVEFRAGCPVCFKNLPKIAGALQRHQNSCCASYPSLSFIRRDEAGTRCAGRDGCCAMIVAEKICSAERAHLHVRGREAWLLGPSKVLCVKSTCFRWTEVV